MGTDLHHTGASKRSGGASGALVAALGLAFALAGCVPPQPPPPRPTEAQVAEQRRAQEAQREQSKVDPHAARKDGLTGGKLVFSDDFERAELGPDWQHLQPGEWQIENGWLKANQVPVYDDRNKGVWLLRELPEKTRVEFKARAIDERGDTKCEIFARTPSHEAGYSLILGGWNNTINTIARLGEHEPNRVVQQPHQPVETDHTYAWTIVRTDNVVRWYIDGKFMIAYDDRDPVKGRYFGFNNWLTKVFFDEVRVWAL